jgi:hypothetical protein
MENNLKSIKYKTKYLENKKVISIEKLRCEFGRTYDNYLCFTCEDGTRVMLHGGEPFDPKPPLEEMRKVNFFTPEEIGLKLEQIERQKRQREKDLLNKKRRELEKLKKELGEI